MPTYRAACRFHLLLNLSAQHYRRSFVCRIRPYKHKVYILRTIYITNACIIYYTLYKYARVCVYSHTYDVRFRSRDLKLTRYAYEKMTSRRFETRLHIQRAKQKRIVTFKWWRQMLRFFFYDFVLCEEQNLFFAKNK